MSLVSEASIAAIAAMPALLKDFPYTRWHPEVRLLAWHPRGILDDELAESALTFIETEERIADGPFDRYVDFSGLTDIRLAFGHTFEIAERRMAAYAGREPVKSAVFCNWIIGQGVARLYAELTKGGLIDVRVFHTRDGAAEWLGVTVDILQPDAGADFQSSETI